MPELPVWAQWRAGQLMVRLHVQPGARRSAVIGTHGQRLKVALHAPPVDGKANEELLRHLGAVLQMRANQFQLVAGSASREKTVAIASAAATAAGLAARLLAAADGPPAR